jgi:putative phosphoesterase
MRVAILADIHGNLAALEAVADDIARWRPDAVAVAGDIVNRGPRSLACLRFVQARAADSGWRVIRGNHEDYVIDVARRPDLRPPGLEGAVRANVRWTRTQLGDAAAELELLPERLSLEGPGGELRVVHASMRHNRDNILPDTPEDELRLQIAPAPPAIAVGHTHRPLVRRVDETLVVNVGSVGMPFDGDVRASYGRLEWRGGWEAQIVRVPYDRRRTLRDFEEQAFLRDGGPAAPVVFDEFLTAHPRLSGFITGYGQAVLAGALTPREAARRYLAAIATPPALAPAAQARSLQ